MRSTLTFLRYALATTLVIFLMAQIVLAGPPASSGPLAAGEIRPGYTPDSPPFTKAWVLDHPAAWRLPRPPAEAWTGASFAEATNWLGLGEPANRNLIGYAATRTGPSDAQQVERAGDLVHCGDLDPNLDHGPWLPLGVFALVPPSQNHAQQMVQLTINREGVLQGAYYDVLSDTGQSLYGSLDQPTQRLAWTAGSGDGAIFETTLAALTDHQSPVYLHFGSGESQVWTLVRQSSP